METTALYVSVYFCTYLGMSTLETLWPNNQWPALRWWRFTGVSFLLLLAGINAAVGAVAGQYFPGAAVFDGQKLGVVYGSMLGFIVNSCGNAALHRCYHASDFLWRHVHKMHHKPARLDVAGVMYQSPWEGLLSAVLFVSVTQFLLGLSAQATLLCAFATAFYGMFQHWNVKTPRWLGLLIQRPEAHCLHHEHDQHRWNYSDFPLWDMLCGTFRNPEQFRGKLGL
jgi:sterol desaturase/sphingolipid hydroxylase (fatty acid hydroxylase superfamily)